MNKAFVREPEQGTERRPLCGSLGQPVGAVTLDAFLRADARELLGESAFFCPSETCRVAYFDAFERSADVDDLVRPVFPKDPVAAICGCFGLTQADVAADVREGTATRTRALLERAKSPEARCSQMSAGGQSCVAAVQRCYMKLRGSV